jgi:hypothetical protein
VGWLEGRKRDGGEPPSRFRVFYWGADREETMRYRVFSGPPGTSDVSSVQRDQMLFKECTTLDEALSWARHLDKGGRTPLLIEGDDGTHMDKRGIIEALRIGGREEVDAPFGAAG